MMFVAPAGASSRDSLRLGSGASGLPPHQVHNPAGYSAAADRGRWEVAAGLVSASAAVLAAGTRRWRRRQAAAGRASQVRPGATAQAVDLPSLEKLDALLDQAISAEVDGAPSEVVENAEAQALRLLDTELSGRLPGFGTGDAQVEKREYTLKDLAENGIEAAKLLSPQDTTLDGVRQGLSIALAVGGAALIILLRLTFMDLVLFILAGTTGFLVDQLVNQGGLEFTILDTIGRAFNAEYRNRVAMHEAGHFLVAYLVGILPKAYTLSALDAVLRYKSPGVQAGCTFCDKAFQAEVATGTIKGKSLDRVVCVAVAGVAIEFLLFGQANGGITDIQQMEALFQSLRFDQRRTNAQLRWSVLNVVGLLRRYADVHKSLAEAMLRGALSESVSRL
mmetsp:Transcript_9381/g.24268  ORF Transcript_9381/g.24268 Transcript_9381/m.24268 type:complete len:392 (+) Transcript_9381:42-1217(+)